MPHYHNKRYQTGLQHKLQGYAHNYRLINDKIAFLQAMRQEVNSEDAFTKISSLLETVLKQRAQLITDFEAEILR